MNNIATQEGTEFISLANTPTYAMLQMEAKKMKCTPAMSLWYS